jgi:hypothetical protein
MIRRRVELGSMNWNGLTENEQEMYRELSKKIDRLKFVVTLLCVFTAMIVWKLA